MQQLTPICDEQLWIQNFDVVNEIFTTLPVVVTLVVMFFHYREVDFARNSYTHHTASRVKTCYHPRPTQVEGAAPKMVKILKARFITSLKKEEQVIDSHRHHSHHRHHRHHL